MCIHCCSKYGKILSTYTLHRMEEHMARELNRFRTQIDFRPTRGHLDADILYTVLSYYTRGGSTDMTASQLIATSYTNFDASETEEITKIIDTRHRARSFARYYEIKRKKDIIRLVVSEEPDNFTNDLIEPDKKFVCFNAEEPGVEKMWDTLNNVRFRDRGIIINKWLSQYFSHGKCEYYLRLCAARLLRWLREEYQLMKDIDTAKLNAVIDCLWVNSQEIDDAEVIPTEEIVFPDEKEARLRELMGLR